MKSNKKIENLLYIFILINPILDILSGKFYIGSFSITMFLRPLLPLCLLLYIFIKDKDERKKLLILGIIYVLYGIFHLYIYNKTHVPFAYGNAFHEMTYVVNYTYLMFTLYLYIYIFKNIKEDKLYKCLFIHNLIYIISIIIATLTKTYNTTYVEGLGNMGWFNAGGAVGAVLILSLLMVLPQIFKDKKNILIKIFYLLSIYIYLLFFLGTRVGLYGSILTLIVYVIANGFIFIFQKKKIDAKKLIIPIVLVLLILLVLYYFGSVSQKRREHLDDIAGKNPFDETADTIYMAYDFVLLSNKIKNNQIEKGFMTKEQQTALLKLDEYTTKNKYVSTNVRGQQLLYHYYLYIEQKSIPQKLFGNGYLSNMGALTLEMETLALFFNFGIIGFILYFIPFLIVIIYGICIALKNIKKITIDFIMLLCASVLSVGISFYSGHIYFNTSVMIIVIVMYTLLIKEIQKLRGKK